MAELNRARVAAVLAADAELNVRAGLFAEINCHLHQFAHAFVVKLCKWIGFNILGFM